MTTKDDSVTYWMNQAGRFPLLSKDEILRLSKIIHTKGADSPAGQRAVSKLVRHNLRLVPMVVRALIRKRREYRTDDQSMCDYLQAGTLGLHRAACLFDYSRGYAFSTYAYMWIRQAVQRNHYVMYSPIHVPESYYNSYSKFSTFEAQEEMRKEDPAAYTRHLAAHMVLSGINSLEFTSASGDTLEASADPAFLTNRLEAIDTVDDLLELADVTDQVKDMVIESCVEGKSIGRIARERKLSYDATKRKIKNCMAQVRAAIS